MRFWALFKPLSYLASSDTVLVGERGHRLITAQLGWKCRFPTSPPLTLGVEGFLITAGRGEISSSPPDPTDVALAGRDASLLPPHGLLQIAGWVPVVAGLWW